MKILRLIPILLVTFGTLPLTNNSAFANDVDPNSYKVLNINNNISSLSIQNYLKKGDSAIKKGDFDAAKESYDKARNLAKQLSSFYRDLNSSFRGLDARIPKEMDKKGRESIELWAESNSRLAAYYNSKKQSEVAVPLLVEIIRLMGPSSPQGKEAYKNLIEIGFVETPFNG
tara:strand:- start:481 stop:996 length:516 start_codon:yes stop_codon:yes gene_type:complete